MSITDPQSPGEPESLAPGRRWHLAENAYEEALTAFEFAILQVEGSFQRFAVQSIRVAADLDLGFNEVVALHVVRMQERSKDTATIAQLTNRDDLPNLQYNLRKLVSMGLLERTKSGTSSVFTVTAKGREITDRYAQLRRQTLVSNLEELSDITTKMHHAVRSMQVLTGLYEAASRELATINTAMFFEPLPDEAPAAETEPPKKVAGKTRARSKRTQS
ncbi:MarR family transcriptional regulator [Rhodococcus sp. TAF43]|jgi:predicted MarR family transcription regulator|uniref:helix-turn-helix domain-containing protein n=1 Tax=unclassified Rhodococcus (in: high G+C Gram-positive bacteria) TaxID=192944 RepID=UPI000E0AECE5|nr:MULTISPECIES: winged helix DNA-binding protein [unclassified Rhodococcus (in: high G+C Gram-positive bacteria)]QKT09394.1 winged helix DNA-binding protein [Rhodococcus sp. W8901]RDI30644.1 putative MarR family transcription regulator [Rhodococcus sp. AG1013]